MRAMVLCAGYGIRLGDLTRRLPKPMLPLHDKPLLAYTLRYLAQNGFTEIAINLHYMPDMIPAYFGSGEEFGIKIVYSYEEQLLGTAGGPKQVEDFLATEGDFLVLYGDLLIDQHLAPMVALHRERSGIATLMVHQRHASNSLVCMDQTHRITGFLERPTEDQRRANPFPWVNSGVYLLNAKIFEYIPPDVPYDFPRDVFAKLVRHPDKHLYGFPLTAYRCAIDSPKRYKEAQAAITEGRYQGPFSS